MYKDNARPKPNGNVTTLEIELQNLKENNQQLKEWKRFVTDGLNCNNSIIFIYDEEKDIICCNDNEYFQKMFNIECLNKINISIKDLIHIIHPEDLRKFLFLSSDFMQKKVKKSSIIFRCNKTKGDIQSFYLKISFIEESKSKYLCLLTEIDQSAINKMHNPLNKKLKEEEKEICKFLTNGKTHKEIQKIMKFGSLSTLDSKIKNIYLKMGVTNIASLLSKLNE
jgi:DNA-binding CsgD family transcriptional regulator